VTAIALGQFVPGQRLPTERELAAMLSVSRATVREAIARLAEAGYVTVRRGRSGGTFVTSGWRPESDEMIRRTLSNEWQETGAAAGLPPGHRAADRADGGAAPDRYRRQGHPQRAGGLRAGGRGPRLLPDGRPRAAPGRRGRHAQPAPDQPQPEHQARHQFGFEAEPYSPEVRGRALHQHPVLAQAVIDGNPDQAAGLAAEHFSLTESMLRELHARVMLRAGTPQEPQEPREPRE